MPNDPTALELLRAAGLMPDGPVTWGQPVRSRSAGIFVVELTAATEAAPIDSRGVLAWLQRAPDLKVDGERPTQAMLAARLASFWLPRQRVLYVGRTSKSLGGRVGAAYATRLGDRKPHPGGHWLKTLLGLERLRVWWAETEAPEEYEDAVLALFAAGVPVADRGALPTDTPLLPWAVQETATGERRETGITNPFGDEGTVPAETTPAMRRRSAAAAATTRRKAAILATSATLRVTGKRRSPADAKGRADEATHLTADGLKALESELDEMRTVKRPEVILRVKAARELGDLRENADYEAARNEQSFLEGRIRAIEQMVRSAVVIERDRTGEVMLGSTVRVDMDGDEVMFHIVGSTEADPTNGRISNQSPIGKAILGHRAGDTVTAQLPGRELTYRIISVE
jgi:transcription elongation factor GreA